MPEINFRCPFCRGAPPYKGVRQLNMNSKPCFFTYLNHQYLTCPFSDKITMVKLAYVETPFPQEKIEVRRGEGVYTGWVKQFFFF